MREYAALPHEYLEEMAELTDVEFGRLCRALLRYSMTGEASDLPGNERFFWVRVVNREGRYQTAFEEATEKRRAAANIRWEREREMHSNAMHCNTNTNTNTNTDTDTDSKTKTKSDSYPNTRRSKERREAAGAAVEERVKKDMKWLEEFLEKTESPAKPEGFVGE